MKRILIFASGSGTNAKNIIEYFGNRPTATVVAVFSNNSNAAVLDKAQKLNIPTVIFSKEELNLGKTLQIINNFQPDLIVLAGFLLKVPENLIEAFPNRIINIHPALLPKFGGKGMYGANVHKAVIEAQEKESGITIHFVNEEYDKGEIILQAKCEISSDETIETLSEKIHQLEYEFLPKAVDKVISGI